MKVKMYMPIINDHFNGEGKLVSYHPLRATNECPEMSKKIGAPDGSYVIPELIHWCRFELELPDDLGDQAKIKFTDLKVSEVK